MSRLSAPSLSFSFVIDSSGTPQSGICRLSCGVLQPAPPYEAMADPAEQKYGCGVTFPMLQIPQITQCNMASAESLSDITTLSFCYHHRPPCLQWKFVLRKVRALEEAP